MEAVDNRTIGTARGLRPTTRASYRRQLDGYAIPFFGKRRLDELTPADVRDYAAYVGREVEKKTGGPAARDTIRLALAPVKALLGTARDDGLIPSNPSAGSACSSPSRSRRPTRRR